jgi:3-oxoacyl-(acyl-carrier-protein) synthase
MMLRIAGMGWVTPLGRNIKTVWQRLLQGEAPPAQALSRDPNEPSYPAYLVPSDDLKNLSPHPRLRRASAISRFAAAAGLDALEDARTNIGNIDLTRTALIFAVSHGGVIYTTRFYRDIVKSGPESASPLLFPETVFNAPASHLAAILGITGITYTLVGDGAVGIFALKMAEDLMTNETIENCLVVGAEEADWLLCDAYHRWRLTKSRPPIEPFRKPPRGTILSEGAGAVVVGRKGVVGLKQIHPGANFRRRAEAGKVVTKVLSDLADPKATLLVASANGTFIDSAESAAIAQKMPNILVYACKTAFGESVGASATWQVIVAAQALLTKSLPPVSNIAGDTHASRPVDGPRQAIVSSCGMNQQVAGLTLST